MRRFLPLVLLLLVGCGSTPEAEFIEEARITANLLDATPDYGDVLRQTDRLNAKYIRVNGPDKRLREIRTLLLAGELVVKNRDEAERLGSKEMIKEADELCKNIVRDVRYKIDED